MAVIIDGENGINTPHINVGNSSSKYEAQVMVCAGGGGNSPNIYDDAAGSGGGGVIFQTINLIPDAIYEVIIGPGGTGSNKGGNSKFSNTEHDLILLAYGGAYGGHHRTGFSEGGCGSGQGGYYSVANDIRRPGPAIPGQGFAGGSPISYRGGGGGGAGSEGTPDGNGGTGFRHPVTNEFFGGGGGGYPLSTSELKNGYGGEGGGGNSRSGTGVGSNGSANTGGGAGAGKGGSSYTSNGGSGIVIISYLGDPRGTGGTITSVNGYTVHKFTTSGDYIG